ncbi:hypothetical protein HD599_003234 [Conyzicola lurida]|uniref:Uncharacterized protein n=1 Tax=Conyzicola lurida TaxID=1172621 RepID=A0A841ASY7_9MICO|nr:hypothetical protein [Conyzicola lurida]MBB5844911.1 hypothetical protein [Conyzicola lurida]
MPASASEIPANDGDARVIEWYLAHGVDEDVAASLVAKFNSGELLDSMKADSVPVDIATVTTADEEITTSTFADGSVSVVALETPKPADPNARGIGTCSSITSGTGYTNYTNCDIWGSNAYLELHFRADYTRSGGTNGSIARVGSPYQYATGGTATTPQLSITRSFSSAAGPATAQGVSQYSSSATTFTAYLYLKVAANATTSTTGL